MVLLLILFSKIRYICDEDVFATAQVSRAVYTSPSESIHLFRSLLSDIVHSTAIHYIGISERVSDFGHTRRFLVTFSFVTIFTDFVHLCLMCVTKAVISSTGIFVAIANNTLYGSKL